MKKLVSLLIFATALAISSSVAAQTLPPTGQLYFVGTTEELMTIRAAMREFECQHIGPEIEMCTYPSPGCSMQPDPYCGENTYSWGEQAQVIPSSFGLGEVDCMTAGASDQTVQLMLGETVTMPDESEVYIPTEEELVGDAELPQACLDYLLAVYCPQTWQEWWCYFGCAPACE